MSAPAHSPARTARRAPTGNRLPWWAAVLPVLSFVVLLVLMTGPGQAHASPAAQDAPGLAYLLGLLLDVLPL
ncbi:hypothetical protein GCM10010329_08990 [Streptomyces spiroverticillatus]|uniref:Uncharacterized protein n=1 Tax=Streptomyces finlayi TaxID=67296 RepID=A0A918WXP4_9ACTN|nr:hypothetical protein [Streptomyces finlayi]GGZ90962.1 hypothetical protein GCM10010329_08990 [Streptomyces spiroverticillatus]GHC94174.1 hypothetical protein GCM10010334_32080 [Streptomyces finlayi]